MSDTTATTPTTPTTPNGSNTKKFEGDGLPFKAKLIGMEDLTVDRDEKVCLESMFKLKAVVRARGEHKQRIQLNLTMNAVKVIDDTTKAQIALHEIEKISFVVIDPRDTRAFGYIYNTSDDRHQFWAIKTERAAALTVVALKELFEIAFEQYTKSENQTANPVPPIANPAPSTPNPAPTTPNPASTAPNPAPTAPNPAPSIPDPTPTTPNPVSPEPDPPKSGDLFDISWETINNTTQTSTPAPTPLIPPVEQQKNAVIGDDLFNVFSNEPIPQPTPIPVAISPIHPISPPILTTAPIVPPPQQPSPNILNFGSNTNQSWSTPLVPMMNPQKPPMPVNASIPPIIPSVSSVASPAGPATPSSLTNSIAALDPFESLFGGPGTKPTKESFFPSTPNKPIQQLQMEKQP